MTTYVKFPRRLSYINSNVDKKLIQSEVWYVDTTLYATYEYVYDYSIN